MAEIEIPEQVKDKDAYIEYLKYSNMKAIRLPDRIIETSDVHVNIDPFCNQDRIDKEISHLSFDEKESILKKIKAARLLRNKMFILRSKAFGTTINSTDHSSISKEQMKMFLDERSSEVLEYYGRYLEDEEVLKIIHTEWGYNISIQFLKRFRLDNREKIISLQEGFRKSLDSSKLYHKRFRLEELWYLYNKTKINFEKTGSREDSRSMVNILKEARTEVDAHEIRIKGEISHKIEMTIGEHIEREIMGDLTITDIIIARVSHRLNVNPAYIMHRLRTSVYARFTGFASPDNSLLEDEIVYPSTMVYNWKDIKDKHNKNEKSEYIDFEEIKDVQEKDSISDLREKLKDRLRKKEDSLDSIKNRVDKNTE